MRKLIAAAIVLVLLTACGGKPLPPGCHRERSGSHIEFMPMYMGKTMYMMPYTVTDYRTVCITVVPVEETP